MNHMNIYVKTRRRNDNPGTPLLSMHINVVEPPEEEPDDEHSLVKQLWVNTDYYVMLDDGIKHKKNHSISITALRFNYILLEEDSKQYVVKSIFAAKKELGK